MRPSGPSVGDRGRALIALLPLLAGLAWLAGFWLVIDHPATSVLRTAARERNAHRYVDVAQWLHIPAVVLSALGLAGCIYLFGAKWTLRKRVVLWVMIALSVVLDVYTIRGTPLGHGLGIAFVWEFVPITVAALTAAACTVSVALRPETSWTRVILIGSYVIMMILIIPNSLYFVWYYAFGWAGSI